MREVVRGILPGVPEELIGGRRHLKDLGADSVDRVEIIATLIERIGISTPMSEFSDIPDIDTLVDFLCKEQRR
ncbi:phosphopantetheine-binding protein [Streptomyces mutabilis]|uniref:phosphopantetheine-binding protein n=1 Tax=Streptomyces mutabilis TaxID=67332 RepID=UPI0022BA199E|nr:phosphopantetheine-binding protein [Streptomyces mutabilis]MCZ9353745.1 phosphopantetheine-binding protein [Streptomyces mutabilis]